MNNRKITLSAVTALVIMITGCTTYKQTEIEFGDAVRQVNAAQVYDTNAAANPDPAAVLGGDPERLNNTLDGHRKDVASPSGVDSPVTINVGNSNK